MGTFATFDHTADVGLRMEAETVDDLFATAGRALLSLMVANPEAVEPRRVWELEVTAESLAELLVAWLDEILFRVETEHVLFSGFDVRVEPNGTRLWGTLRGEPIDASRHALDHEVKAVTRHGCWVRGREDGYEAEVILDI